MQVPYAVIGAGVVLAGLGIGLQFWGKASYGDYDTQVKPNVVPLHALRFTEQGSAGQVTEQVFLAAG